MAKAKTPSFILTLKLNTSPGDEKILHDRFYAAFLMRNRLVSHARKRLRGLRQDRRYRTLMEERLRHAGKSDPASKKALHAANRELASIRREYGLSEYQFHAWIALQKNRCRGAVDIHTAQKLASSVWKAVEAVLFRKGKTVHFAKPEGLSSLEGKSNASGMRFRGGRLQWLGLCIQPRLRRGDAYAREALQHRVKYCRIMKKPVGTRYHWYLQLVLEGLPPQKHKFLPDGRTGIDQGTSTEAVVSKNSCLLAELRPERPDIQREVRRIQRRMDRSARATNPGNFKPDGTPKRHVRWQRSKVWKRDCMRLRSLRRRAADLASQSREKLANRILTEHGSDIFTETMNYKALQARARETGISEKTGRYKRRKRFGASLGRHAPAAFMAVLERKLSYMGKTVNYVDTASFRASRYRHDTDTCEAHSLSSREKLIDGCHVQRDLYSAFLLMNAADPGHPDREACAKSFPLFVKNQQAEIIRLLNEDTRHPSCMGLKEFRYLATG